MSTAAAGPADGGTPWHARTILYISYIEFGRISRGELARRESALGRVAVELQAHAVGSARVFLPQPDLRGDLERAALEQRGEYDRPVDLLDRAAQLDAHAL